MQNDHKEIIRDLLKRKKNFVFIGEAGSGKSELAINFALQMGEVADNPVHLFDMDQTKPLFRSRDVSELLEQEGIIVHSQKQYLDAPTLVPGVIETLRDPDTYVLLDIGGNATGARMIGQFSHVLNDENTMVFFVINTYRPWSKDAIGINETLYRISKVSRIRHVNIISNPNLGLETTAQDVIEGNNKLKEIIADSVSIDYVCVLSELYDAVKDSIEEPLIPVDIFIVYPWLLRNPGKMIPEGPRGLSR
ncbi:MAG: hypothetical protein GXX99_04450 [Clostridiales bacterium]|nr:hypothetical protein [Clostridiales bacterium]